MLQEDNVLPRATEPPFLYVCLYVNLYLNAGNHQLILSEKVNLSTTALHDCRVGIQYISYLLDISLAMLNGCSSF